MNDARHFNKKRKLRKFDIPVIYGSVFTHLHFNKSVHQISRF